MQRPWVLLVWSDRFAVVMRHSTNVKPLYIYENSSRMIVFCSHAQWRCDRASCFIWSAQAWGMTFGKYASIAWTTLSKYFDIVPIHEFLDFIYTIHNFRFVFIQESLSSNIFVDSNMSHSHIRRFSDFFSLLSLRYGIVFCDIVPSYIKNNNDIHDILPCLCLIFWKFW